ncbi:hypothetical protein RhiirA5_347062, partial [Rhizophagus irregularis]
MRRLLIISPVSPDAKTCRSIFGTVIIIVTEVANGQSCILLVNMVNNKILI